jgi:HSP20 family protein
VSAVRKNPRTPPSDLALLQREVNLLFERLGEAERAERPESTAWVPSADVYECGGSLKVVVEVPGLAPESLRVACKDRDLVIEGERRERRPTASSVAFVCMERHQGRFKRVIPIDIAVDLQKAEARLCGGLLIVTLPRLRDRRGRETLIPVRREE